MAASESMESDRAAAVDLLKGHAATVEQYLRSKGARHSSAPPRLLEAIEYSLMAGGKRLRPALVLETARACGAAADNPSALAAAGAIELIHTFSLVHDDLPAMDDDDLRRGRPTNHKVFGEAMAILAGDAMVTTAFEVIATDAEPDLVPALIRELASASGPQGMIGGQVLDIDSENVSLSLEELRHLHRMKTGALIRCACRMGAIAAGADDVRLGAVSTYGRHLGLAFQIIDDLLDVTATREQLGKATSKDVRKGKNTFPKLMGVDRSRTEADEQLGAGIAAISDLGGRAGGLRELAHLVVRRSS